MKPWNVGVLTLSLAVLAALGAAQDRPHDRAMIVEPKNEFLDEITKEADAFLKKKEPAKKELRMDFSLLKAPSSVEAFTRFWHNNPVSQGLSGMCWCFSATSYYESEIYRLRGKKVKLSELYTVYWEYVEKARRFVRERGNSAFGEGSEANAVPRIWRQYGIVPGDAYTGLKPGQKVHDHRALIATLHSYLQSVKLANAWNEDQVLATVRGILNDYLGEPPAEVDVGGTMMTPKAYLASLGLNLDDYVEIMSLIQQPYFQRVELEVPDNWWHSREYINIPVEEFMEILKKAIRKGYTMVLGGDVTEPGYEGHAGVGVIPTFDIPSSWIDDASRGLRFSNGTTGDDHGIHLVGYLQKDGEDWYLIKDSGSGSRNNSHPGYYFYREDYVKLKMLGFTVHRDMVKDLLEKIKG